MKAEVKKNTDDNGLVIQLAGSIDENSDFQWTLEVEDGVEAHIHCEGIQRINSAGVKQWIQGFQDLERRGVKLIFERCPPPLVDQINLISNFLGGGALESIGVPWLCSSCDSAEVSWMDVEMLESLGDNLNGSTKCRICGESMEVDEIEEEYFAFLNRLGANSD